MVNMTILEGLKMGLAKGQSLKDSMMSFYNAGYPKKDIEDAARALLAHYESPHHVPPQQNSQQPQAQSPVQQKAQQFKPLKPKTQVPASQYHYKVGQETRALPALSPTHKVSQTQQTSQLQKESPSKEIQKTQFPLPVSQQKVSGYGQEADTKGKNKKLYTILLILFFVCLLGLLVSLFIFKDQFLEMFNILFG